MPLPHKVFLEFPKTIYPLHLSFSVAVCISLRHILVRIGSHGYMVGRYKYLQMVSPFLTKNPRFLPRMLKNKKVFNYVIFQTSSIKKLQYAPFFGNF